MPDGWLSRLSIGKKLALSFSVIFVLLIGSLGASLFYLSRVNSYVDRHKRITVPAIVTAANMQREVYDLKLALHLHVKRNSPDSIKDTISRLDRHSTALKAALELYNGTHAARTHPILYRMLADHHRLDLAEQEDRALADIAASLDDLTVNWKRLLESPSHLQPAMDQTDRLVRRMIDGLDQLVNAHTQIDIEMKHEGDQLLGRARLIALSLALILALVIAATYVLATRHIAHPLVTLAATADRVAHQDLSASFEPWPSRDEVGTLTASLTSMLTSLRERGTALMRKTKELEAFTYSIAHDLKGPLREIEGFSSLLEKHFAEAGDPKVKHHIDVIRKSSLRLTQMIDALLKYSRLEQQDLPRTQFNLLDMVNQLVRERHTQLGGITPTITVDLPFSHLYGEPVSIRQAITNLLDNAIKFSRHSPAPEVRISGRQTATEWILSIYDNGIGFDSGQADKLFGLFERLHPTNEYEGTGVGLAIVKMVMEKHEGRVWAESSPGQGSTFFLAFLKGSEAVSRQP
jgi:signal transduction histidine kinase